MAPPRPLSPRRLRLCKFLATLCWDEFYVPMDVPSQDYTYFEPAGLESIRAAWAETARLMSAGRAPSDLALYVHWPFCVSQCTYCCCDMQVPRGPGLLRSYAAMIKREMAAFSEPLRGRPFNLVWFGGGTPTYMPDDELDGLLAELRRRFTLAPDAELYFEVSPATLTPAKLDILMRHGVNHITLGVQSMDDDVLARVNRRGQTRSSTQRAYDMLRERPGLVADLDLMFGLEGQTKLSFVADLARAMRMRPEVLHLYAFDPRPQTLFAQAGKTVEAGSREDLKVLMRLAARIAAGHGYRSSMMYLDASQDAGPDEIRRRVSRKFGGSVLGLGYSAMSHAWGTAWYQHLPIGSAEPDVEGLPPLVALASSPDEELRAYVVRNLSLYGKVYYSGFREAFQRDLRDLPWLLRPLRDLEASGSLRLEADAAVLPTPDLVERLVLVKHLYSAPLVRRLLRRHRAAWDRFRAAHPLGEPGWPAEAREKIEARSLLMVCFREDVAATSPRPTAEPWSSRPSERSVPLPPA